MGGLKFCTLFFVLTISIWLSSMPCITEARPLNGLGVPSNAGETGGVFEKLSKIESSSGLSSGGRGHSYKYSRVTAEILKFGPSPGEGHKNVSSDYQWFSLSIAPKGSSFICPISRSKRWCVFLNGWYVLVITTYSCTTTTSSLSLRVFYSEPSLSCLCDQTCFGKYTICMESYQNKK